MLLTTNETALWVYLREKKVISSDPQVSAVPVAIRQFPVFFQSLFHGGKDTKIEFTLQRK